MEQLGIFSVLYNPNLLNGIAPQKPYPYGQIGTLLRCEITFATSVPIGAATFKYGWVKNSTIILQPTTDPLEAFKILNTYFENLNTNGGQAWNGTTGELNYMNPVSGKDGTATLETTTITADTWLDTITYPLSFLVDVGGVTYISKKENNVGNDPLTVTDWWALASVYKLTQTLRIQPFAKLSDFDANGVYLKSPYLQNFESVKNVYEINVKDSPASPVNVASTASTDPQILSGTIGFLDEKLNGLPIDIILTDLTINNDINTITEIEENTISFTISSSQYTLSEADSTINIIAHDLDVPDSLNQPYIELINFSSAVKNSPDNYIKSIDITETSSGVLDVLVKIADLSAERSILIYANITSNNIEESEQSLPLFFGLPEAIPAPSVFDTIKTPGANIEGFEFLPEYANLIPADAFENVAAFSEDIVISRFSFYRVNKEAKAVSINIQLINDNSEVVENEDFAIGELPVSKETDFHINSTDRKTIKIDYDTLTDSYTVICPFKINQNWANRTELRLKISVSYDLENIIGVSTFESAVFRLGSYDETKNTNLEPQVLPLNQKSIEILSEDGNTTINQFNKDTNSRIRADFEDKNPITNDLQAEQADLVGYIGVASSNNVNNSFIIHSVFGAEPVTPFIEIDGSINPECKITKLDSKTARVEAVVDTAKLVEMLGQSTNYQVFCRIDKKELAKLSVEQTTFIFNYNSVQKYNFTLDADLLISSYLDVYYSFNFPTVLTFTHVLSATSLTDFSIFAAYVNSNASPGDIITIENTTQSEESNNIVKLNIPKSGAIPVSVVNTSVLPANSVEHDNLFVFDNKIEVNSIAIGAIPESEIYYAFRAANSELVTFSKYNKSEINGLILNLPENESYILHFWGARSGGSEPISLDYNILDGNEVLVKSNVFSENLNNLRSLWVQNSLRFASNQIITVGDELNPYQQIEVRDNFTFYFVFYQNAIGGRQQLFTTNELLPAVPNAFLSFNTASKNFNVSFIAIDGPTIKSLNYSGTGIKAGYNFVIGHWDSQNESNRHIFINGLLQAGELTNVNDFNVLTDKVVNSFDGALFGANDSDGPSEYFNGNIFDAKLNTELFADRLTSYYDAFRKGEKTFDVSKNLLSVDFDKLATAIPEVFDNVGANYPVLAKVTTIYDDFSTL